MRCQGIEIQFLDYVLGCVEVFLQVNHSEYFFNNKFGNEVIHPQKSGLLIPLGKILVEFWPELSIHFPLRCQAE